MQFVHSFTMKDGAPCLLRHLTAADGQAEYELYALTHAQSPYLTGYPDENTHTPEKNAEDLERAAEDPSRLELGAFVNGRLVGSASMAGVGRKDKVRHRCRIGLSVEESFCSRGIGRALMEGCIASARQAGYVQAELDVAAENARALGLYTKLGFTEFARNPLEWRTREGRWQEVVYMRLVLRPEETRKG